MVDYKIYKNSLNFNVPQYFSTNRKKNNNSLLKHRPLFYRKISTGNLHFHELLLEHPQCPTTRGYADILRTDNNT